MSDEEKKMLNEYHAAVYEKVGMYLGGERARVAEAIYKTDINYAHLQIGQ